MDFINNVQNNDCNAIYGWYGDANTHNVELRITYSHFEPSLCSLNLSCTERFSISLNQGGKRMLRKDSYGSHCYICRMNSIPEWKRNKIKLQKCNKMIPVCI